MSIIFEHVFKYYGTQVATLQNIELSIDKGMFGLLGPNGAGKTTLLRIMASVLSPSKGRVVIDHYDLSKTEDRQAVRQHIGYLPQDAGLYPDLNGEEFLDYFALLKGVYRRDERKYQITQLLNLMNLTRIARQKIKTYSGGMKRRLGIAQALLGNPRVIIVDEPTAGLDPDERIRIRQVLSELAHDRTIVLSTHLVEDISQTCEHIALLNEGQILFQGYTRDVVTLAEGYTWELVGDKKQDFPSTIQIVARVPRLNDVLYRIVGELNSQFPCQVRPVAPTLEDGYVRLRQMYSSKQLQVGNIIH